MCPTPPHVNWGCPRLIWKPPPAPPALLGFSHLSGSLYPYSGPVHQEKAQRWEVTCPRSQSSPRSSARFQGQDLFHKTTKFTQRSCNPMTAPWHTLTPHHCTLGLKFSWLFPGKLLLIPQDRLNVCTLAASPKPQHRVAAASKATAPLSSDSNCGLSPWEGVITPCPAGQRGGAASLAHTGSQQRLAALPAWTPEEGRGHGAGGENPAGPEASLLFEEGPLLPAPLCPLDSSAETC